MMISASERLRRFYDQFSPEHHVLVLINADPDAIASAMAVKRLLWRKVSGITISNVNIINRPDNLAMIRLLRVNLTFINDIEPGRYGRVVMVDSQPDHHEAFRNFETHVVIDHHPDTTHAIPYKDIRPKYGATASIMTEYLRAAKIKPSTKLATGLFHAIKTDTSNLERQTLIEDMRAFQFLFRHANPHLARKIEQAELSLDFLGYFAKALKEKRMRRGRLFAHLGRIQNPDICVVIADFFMRVNSVTWSIVSGIYDHKLIIVLRNDGVRKNAGQTAKKSFGSMGSAGGHKGMARAEIPLDELRGKLDPANGKRLSNWIIRQIERKAEP
ncbi:MAG TPA: phosphoesterase [Deltaproteobacteria bacterium]|nr:phosphoesterase [Deltaproteobacteria bacterium]